ncbi:MAG TPA: DUF3606 domain-containing protein [Puia sp.]|nr:DUF3606 domain-containing protein [Puia sp.]
MLVSKRKQPKIPQQVNINKPKDITYWTKKWEISAHQLLAAMINTKSTSVDLIADYLERFGFYNLPTDRN